MGVPIDDGFTYNAAAADSHLAVIVERGRFHDADAESHRAGADDSGVARRGPRGKVHEAGERGVVRRGAIFEVELTEMMKSKK